MDAGPARPLYERVLDVVGAGAGTELLDVGCGTGLLARLAVDRGARVHGIDADPDQLAGAAALVPTAELIRAEAHQLPVPDDRYDAVTCVQLLMHVPNPLLALREAARAARPGAAVAVTVWGPPERCAIGVFGQALAPLLGHPPPGHPTHPDRLPRLVGLAGMTVTGTGAVVCPFDYPDDDRVLADVFASDIGRRALRTVSPAKVRTAVLKALEPYRSRRGGYRLENTFRYLLATAPGGGWPGAGWPGSRWHS